MSQPADSPNATESPDSEPNALPEQSNRPWQKGAIALGVIAILGGGVWVGQQLLNKNSAPPAAAQSQRSQAMPVKLKELQAETLIESSQFIGNLEAKERVILRPETAGRITRLLVESGDRVNVGTPIAQLSPERSEAELNRAQADVESARSAIRTAQAELASAQADVRSAQSEVNLQQEEYERTQFLVSEGAQAQQQLDRVQRDRESALSQLEAAQKQVDAARSRLEEERSALNSAQSQVAVIREDLKDTRVLSPINGTIGDIRVELGEYLRAGDEIAAISQNNILDLNLRIPIEQAERLQKGLSVEIINPNSDQPLLTGEISFIAPQVDVAAQAVLAKAVFPNSNGKLKDDQFVRSRVIWEETTGVLIPVNAVSRLGGQTFAFVAEQSEDSDQLVAKQRLIQLGEIQGNSYQVLSGLESGETLISSGILNLSDGAPIMPQSESESQQ